MQWNQEEFLKQREENGKKSIEVLLIDTINKPIDGEKTILYNPYILKEYPKETIFVFYCDTGKTTKDRLKEYQKKFPNNLCISLKGGRGYWNKSY